MLTESNFPNGSAIPPNGARLLTPDSGIDVGSASTETISDQRRGLWEQRIESYLAQSSVEVSLELVVFADGTALGRDDETDSLTSKCGWMLTRVYTIRAIRCRCDALHQSVREALNQGLEALPPDSVRDPFGLQVAAVIATDYWRCQEFAAAYLAAQVTE
jgi:hypothetical protein